MTTIQMQALTGATKGDILAAAADTIDAEHTAITDGAHEIITTLDTMIDTARETAEQTTTTLADWCDTHPLDKAARLLRDGAVISDLGVSTVARLLHEAPIAVVREILAMERKAMRAARADMDAARRRRGEDDPDGREDLPLDEQVMRATILRERVGRIILDRDGVSIVARDPLTGDEIGRARIESALAWRIGPRIDMACESSRRMYSRELSGETDIASIDGAL